MNKLLESLLGHVVNGVIGEISKKVTGNEPSSSQIDEYRANLLELVSILRPAFDYIKQNHPEHAILINWAENFYDDAVKSGVVPPNCNCLPCSQPK
jgi:hypothetical protein